MVFWPADWAYYREEARENTSPPGWFYPEHVFCVLLWNAFRKKPKEGIRVRGEKRSHRFI
jgi:hypothetical protein